MVALEQLVDPAGRAQLREAPILDADGRQTRVRLDRADATVGVDLEPQCGGVDRSDRAAVGHDQDAPPFIGACYLADRRQHTRAHLLVGLAVVPARPAREPAAITLGEPRLGLFTGKA